MRLIFMFWILFKLFPRIDGQFCSSQENCRQLEFKPDHTFNGKRLNHHVFRFDDVMDGSFCEMQCYMEPNCVSYNLKKVTNVRGKYTCELNNSTFEGQKKKLETKSEYLYRGAKNACLKGPCKNSATCQTGFTSKGYRCLCAAGFEGPRCKKECNDRALGMENNDIPNSAITASSFYDQTHESWRARLNNVKTNLSEGSWSAKSKTVGEWLQIDLGKETVVTKIATQGRPSDTFSQWITSYNISYSSDNTTFKEYKENGTVKVFSGNSDRDTVVLHVLSSKITARYVRFSIMSWNNHISMRAELYGCAYGP